MESGRKAGHASRGIIWMWRIQRVRVHLQDLMSRLPRLVLRRRTRPSSGSVNGSDIIVILQERCSFSGPDGLECPATQLNAVFCQSNEL